MEGTTTAAAAVTGDASQHAPGAGRKGAQLIAKPLVVPVGVTLTEA